MLPQSGTNIARVDTHKDGACKSENHGAIYVFDLCHIQRRLDLLPANAPPPRLHYTTFWRSLTKKIYNKRLKYIEYNAMEIDRL